MIKLFIIPLIYAASFNSVFASEPPKQVDAEAAKTTAGVVELSKKARAFKLKNGRSAIDLTELQKSHPVKRFAPPPVPLFFQKHPELRSQVDPLFADVFFKNPVSIGPVPGQYSKDDLSFSMGFVDQQTCMALGHAFLLEGARYEARFKKPWLVSFGSWQNERRLTLWAERGPGGIPTEQNLEAARFPCQNPRIMEGNFRVFWRGIESLE